MHLVCPHCHHPIEVVEAPASEVVCPSCGSSVHVAGRGSTLGTTHSDGPQQIGRFTILQLVGQGAFGAVYKARDDSLDRFVAVKIPRAGNLPASGAARDRFLREARSAAQLRHASIVSVHEVGEHTGLPYLVSDFIEGVTLADLLSARTLTARESAQLLAEVADALHFAHERGVVHRDVKPSNIMLGTDGRPLVMDFGLAKRDAGEITMTVEGQVLGTPAYMAPEQARGEGHDADRRSDVYSLGVILYQLLTGELPFRGTTRMLLHQVLHDEPRPPRKLNDRIPRDLETVCLKAMAKEPRRRYASAAELSDDLRRWLDGRPILARPVSRIERGWRWCRRNPTVAAALTGVAISLALGTVVASVFAVRANNEANRARQSESSERDARAATELERQNVAREKDQTAQALYVAQIHGAFAQLLNHNRAAALYSLDTTQRSLRGWEYGYLIRLAEGTPLALHSEAGVVSAVAFSADGTRLAAGGSDGAFRVWDTLSGAELLTLRRPASEGWQLRFSPDGARLADGGRDGSVRIRDARTGAELLTLRGHTDRVTSLAFSPDTTRLASGDFGGTVRVWDARSGADLLTLGAHLAFVTAVALSPDGTRLASGGANANNDGTFRVWDAYTGAGLFTLRSGTSLTTALAFGPEGNRLASGGYDGSVRVWDAGTGAELLTLRGHTESVDALAFSPDGTRLATGSRDRTFRVWDARSGAELLTLPSRAGAVRSLAFSPDGNRLATGELDGTVRVWHARAGADLVSLRGLSGAVGPLAVSPDGARLASLVKDGSVQMWDARTGADLLAFRGHTGKITSLAFSADATRLAAGAQDNTRLHSGASGKDGTILVWDTRTGAELLTLRAHAGPTTSLAFSPDGTRLAAGGSDGRILVWDAHSGAELLTIPCHAGGALWLAFSPDGTRLAAADIADHGTLFVWDADTGAELLTIRGHLAFVTALTFSPDGARLAAGGRDGSVRVWDAGSGAELLTLRGHTDSVGALAFSHDGARLAARDGARNHTVRVWDAHSGVELLTLPVHADAVGWLAFSPDNTRLISGGRGGKVQLWDARVSADQITLRVHTGQVIVVGFSPDGAQLAAGGSDGTVRVWDAHSGAELLTLHGHTREVKSLAFSLDCKLLEAKDNDGKSICWELQSGQTVDHKSPVSFQTSDSTGNKDWHVSVDGARIQLNSREKSKHDYDLLAEDTRRHQVARAPWHLEDVEAGVQNQDAFATAFHLTQVNSLRDLTATELSRRGHWNLRLGWRARGVADLADPKFANETDTTRLEWHALACSADRNRPRYQTACSRFLSLAGSNPNAEMANRVAWTCCLGPEAFNDLSGVVSLAEKALAAQPRDAGVLNTLGSALVRAGRPADALGKLEESIRLLASRDVAHNEIFLALAHHQLGHAAEARRWLEAAARKMDAFRAPAAACGTLGVGYLGPFHVAVAVLAKRPDPREGKDDNSLRDWLEMDILRAEADAALGVTSAAP